MDDHTLQPASIQNIRDRAAQRQHARALEDRKAAVACGCRDPEGLFSQLCLERHPDLAVACTRARGHDGAHRACGRHVSQHALAEWVDDAALEGLEPCPA